MKTKRFDCVEMKNRAQERIRQELANATREEELANWRRIDKQFLARHDAKQFSTEKELVANQSD